MFRGDFSPSKCHERRESGGAERFNPLLRTRTPPRTLRSPTHSHVSPGRSPFRGEALAGRGGCALSLSLQQPCSRGRLGPASNRSSSPRTLLSLTFLKDPLDSPLILLCCVTHDGFRWVGLGRVASFTLGWVVSFSLGCVGSFGLGWGGQRHSGWAGCASKWSSSYTHTDIFQNCCPTNHFQEYPLSAPLPFLLAAFVETATFPEKR